MSDKKTEDQYFRDWEGEAFGFGYGTGEPHVLAALKAFVDNCHWNAAANSYVYKYDTLEKELGAATTWLLINSLCKDGAIGYGTSPRYGWFHGPGRKLVDYIKNHTVDQMYDILLKDDPYIPCGKTYCNCAKPASHQCKGNPFWRQS